MELPDAPETPSATAVPPVTSGATVFSGLVWSGLAHLLPQLYALAQSVVAARILGPEGMGQQSFIAWAQISLTVLFTGGLPIAVTRYVSESVGARREGAVAHLFRWSWRIEAAGAVVGASVLVLISTTRPELRSAWVLAGIACAMAVLHTVPNAVLIGLQRFKDASIVGLVLGAVGTVAVVIVLLAGGGIAGMFAVEVCVSAAALAWASHLARARVSTKAAAVQLRYQDFDRRVLRYAALASIRVLFALIVWRRSELFFLERYSDAAEIAFYSVAFAMFSALSEVPSALLAALFPAIATLYGAGETARIRSGFERALRLLIVVTFPVLIAAVLAGPRALSLLYGGDYERTGEVLVILLCAFPFYVLFKLGGALLQGMDLLPKMFPVDIAAMVVDFGLAFALVPKHGAIGAGVANASAQITAGVLLLTIAVRQIGNVSWKLADLSRSVLASVAMGGAMRLVLNLEGPMGLGIAVLAGLGTYFAVASSIGVIPADDATWLDANVGTRLRGLVGRLARVLSTR